MAFSHLPSLSLLPRIQRSGLIGSMYRCPKSSDFPLSSLATTLPQVTASCLHHSSISLLISSLLALHHAAGSSSHSSSDKHRALSGFHHSQDKASALTVGERSCVGLCLPSPSSSPTLFAFSVRSGHKDLPAVPAQRKLVPASRPCAHRPISIWMAPTTVKNLLKCHLLSS